jgi:uncharacterized protein
MKYLLILVIAGVVYWLWRSARQEGKQVRHSNEPRKPNAPGVPQSMLRCAHCGVHMPETDAVRGRRGVYCSAPHRTAAGDA